MRYIIVWLIPRNEVGGSGSVVAGVSHPSTIDSLADSAVGAVNSLLALFIAP